MIYPATPLEGRNQTSPDPAYKSRKLPLKRGALILVTIVSLFFNAIQPMYAEFLGNFVFWCYCMAARENLLIGNKTCVFLPLRTMDPLPLTGAPPMIFAVKLKKLADDKKKAFTNCRYLRKEDDNYLYVINSPTQADLALIAADENEYNITLPTSPDGVSVNAVRVFYLLSKIANVALQTMRSEVHEHPLTSTYETIWPSTRVRKWTEDEKSRHRARLTYKKRKPEIERSDEESRIIQEMEDADLEGDVTESLIESSARVLIPQPQYIVRTFTDLSSGVGHVFPYFVDCMQSEPALIPRVIGRYFLRGLGGTKAAINTNYESIRRGVRAFSNTPEGLKLTHIFWGIENFFVNKAQIQLLAGTSFDSYSGFFLRTPSTLIVNGVLHEPLTGEPLSLELKRCDEKVFALGEVARMLTDKPLKDKEDESIGTVLAKDLTSRSVILEKMLARDPFQGKDAEEFDSYLAATFPDEEYLDMSKDNIDAVFEEMTTLSTPDPEAHIYLTCRIAYGAKNGHYLAQFGPTAPSLKIPSGIEMDMTKDLSKLVGNESTVVVQENKSAGGKKVKKSVEKRIHDWEVLQLQVRPIDDCITEMGNCMNTGTIVQLQGKESLKEVSNRFLFNISANLDFVQRVKRMVTIRKEVNAEERKERLSKPGKSALSALEALAGEDGTAGAFSMW